MNLTPLVLIFLVPLVHGGDSHVNDGKDVVVEERMMEHKHGDHLFNNIAKFLTKMITDVFTKTHLKDKTVVKAFTKIVFIIMDKNNKDVSGQFQAMVDNYLEYKNDELLTTKRHSLSIFGQKLTGPDQNALEWGKAVKELREMVFKLIDQAIETTWCTKENLEEHKKQTTKMFKEVEKKIFKIVEERKFVDSIAYEKFLKDNSKKKKIKQLVNAVEAHIVKVFSDLPQRIKKWCLEATKFYKKH